LITLEPGHFHAALVQKEMYQGVAETVHVYAPLGPDLLAHLRRITAFNSRADNPTSWRLEVHAGPEPLQRLLRDRPGDVVVLSGRNRGKIDRIKAAVDAGLHVLADKPWIISPDDLPTLQAALETAESRGLIAYDIMTERYEITSILQRELINDPEVFGEPEPGDEREPGVFMESVHYLSKTVAGAPLRRPAWFFDAAQTGEGLTDVGTHLVDLVFWILFPGRAIDAGADLRLCSARRWPTRLDAAQFQQLTGETSFPDFLAPSLVGGALDYCCNTRVSYAVRGVHVGLNVIWDYEAAAGGDTHFARFRGSRSRVEVRQGAEQGHRPELYVTAGRLGDRAVARAVARRVEALQTRFPGVAVRERAGDTQVLIPDRYRVGHEAHFGEVTRRFMACLRDRSALPKWEKANMLARYHLTTHGVRLARDPHGPGDGAGAFTPPEKGGGWL
jgi:predicted dehydrogenase